MKRRELLIGAGAGVFAAPIACFAQRSKVSRIGFLGSASANGSARSVGELRAGLRDLGYVDGKTLFIEYRWAEGNYERFPEMLRDLIDLNVDVIVTHGTPGTRAAKRATTTIPIVMAISGDAVATGLVTQLARPEANVTGSTFFLPQLNTKRLELLKEVFPRMTRVAALSNPGNPVSKPIVAALQAAAGPLKLQLEIARVRGPSEFSSAFAALTKDKVEAIVVTEDGEFASSFKAIASLAAVSGVASIGAKEYGDAGGLIGYGVNILSLYRRAAYFIDRILKGARPADLPIEQPTAFELVINQKTARTLGVAMPQSIVLRADTVIE